MIRKDYSLRLFQLFFLLICLLLLMMVLLAVFCPRLWINWYEEYLFPDGSHRVDFITGFNIDNV